MVGNSFKGWWEYFQYEEEGKAEARNALLVVATLIAAVTFQAGVNPPGGVWQETNKTEGHTAGTAIFAHDADAYFVFLSANTVAFTAAVLLIMSLMYNFPFKFEVGVTTVSMVITYGSAIFAVTPKAETTKSGESTPKFTEFRLVLIVAAAPFVMRCLIQLFIQWRKGSYPGSSCLIPPFGKRKPPKNESPQEQT